MQRHERYLVVQTAVHNFWGRRYCNFVGEKRGYHLTQVKRHCRIRELGKFLVINWIDDSFSVYLTEFLNLRMTCERLTANVTVQQVVCYVYESILLHWAWDNNHSILCKRL